MRDSTDLLRKDIGTGRYGIVFLILSARDSSMFTVPPHPRCKIRRWRNYEELVINGQFSSYCKSTQRLDKKETELV